MSEPSSPGQDSEGIHSIEAIFHDRKEFRKHFITEPVYGGIVLPVSYPVAVGDLVSLRIHLQENGAQEVLKGTVLWCQKSGPLFLTAIGFLPAEVETRERLMVA